VGLANKVLKHYAPDARKTGTATASFSAVGPARSAIVQHLAAFVAGGGADGRASLRSARTPALIAAVERE